MQLFKKKTQESESEKVLKNPKILEVNLIKEDSDLTFDWKKSLRSSLIVLGVVFFIIFELYLGLDWWHKDEEIRLEQIKAQTDKTRQEITDLRLAAADALSYQSKTREAGILLDNHIYWTNFFSWWEKNTLSTVNFNGFSGGKTGEYSLAGQAGSFAEVSWQVKQLLGDPMVLEAQVESVSSSASQTREQIAEEAAARALAISRGEEVEESEAPPPAGVSFSLELEMSPEIFKK